MIEQHIPRTQAEYMADKIKEIKDKTGLDVSEKALDWARNVDGLSGLNEGEKAAATVAYQDYAANNGTAATAKDLGAYVKMRQSLEKTKATKARKRSPMAPV